MLVNEQIDVDVSSCYPLARAAQAHRMLEERKTTGKIVLVP
jgi:NADPH2:quinone reductase